MQVFTKESLTKFQNNLSELQALLKDDITKNNCNLHKLCLPARFQIPQFRDLYYSITGEAFQLLDQHIPQNSHLGGRDLVGMVINNNELASDFSKFFPNFEGMLQVYSITRRFERDLGKIFTLTPQLIERLLDCAPPSDKITASMFQLPFENIFLEFGNNEQRQQCEIKGDYQSFTNVIVEGVYLSEHQGTSSANSKEMRDHFGLTDTDKYRVIEIGVSHSPYSLIGATEGKAGAEQLVNYVHLCIPDEDMPLNEALELNRSWLKGSLPDELFKLAYNTILYLNLDSRLQKAFSMPKETKLRLASASNPNKRKKAALAASKDYSHIQIGSTTQYRVLSDVNNLLQHKREKGTKSPHARRGYFGTRYITGEDGEKIPKVTWIRNAIIHKELLTSDEIEFLNRQYDVM